MVEPNTKRITFKKCSSKEEANQELIKSLLGNEPMLCQFLVVTLFNDPYDLSREEIVDALNKLNEKGLLKINKFKDTWLVESSTGVELALVK